LANSMYILVASKLSIVSKILFLFYVYSSSNVPQLSR